MVCIYLIIILAAAVFVFINRNYNAAFFASLPKKGHALRIFYGASLRLYLLWRRFFPEKPGSKVNKMIKSLCTKENVRFETIIYYVKKISTCICIALVFCILGLFACLTAGGVQEVTSLLRNEYGDGTASYELEVSYDGSEETVEIEIEERLYTDEEIYSLFDEAYEEVQILVLADNESFESISSPLNLVSEYGEIDIFWEIEDTDVIDYNGNITAEMDEGESITLNLYAAFSLEDISVIYTFPAVIAAESLSESERLVNSIMEAIEENNDIYESEVSLPESINGKEISFSMSQDDDESIYLLLGIIAAAAVFLVYDKRLEEKMKVRQDQMMADFTEITIKLSLLYEAGLSIYKAWERITLDHEKTKDKKEHFAYREMKLVIEKIKSGKSEGAAYEEFGQRCGLHPYIKLGNILSQNLSKGSRGMRTLLSQEAEGAFEERKRLARKKGEEAGTKMLLPMMLLLVVVIVIVAVPALMSISI